MFYLPTNICCCY